MGAFMRAATRKKRRTVVETALALFAERGYEQVTVDDILQAANISKGTFYHPELRKCISSMNRNTRQLEMN